MSSVSKPARTWEASGTGIATPEHALTARFPCTSIPWGRCGRIGLGRASILGGGSYGGISIMWRSNCKLRKMSTLTPRSWAASGMPKMSSGL